MEKGTIVETIRVPVELMKDIKDIASHKNVDYQALIIRYLEESVVDDLQKVKWCDFVSHTKELLQKHNVPSEAIDELTEKFTY